MSEELMPCPFCGGEPRRMDRASLHTDTGHFWTISCFCGGHSARAYQMGDTEAGVITAWNHRRADAELTRLREENERLRAACETVADRLDYLQNLWSKEGITDRVAQQVRAALAGEGGAA